MDTALLWTVIITTIKLMLVGAMALLIAVSLWTLDHAIRHGAVLETKPGPIRTRAQTPLRYWLYIVGQLLFVAAAAVTIHVFIHLGDRRELPETNTHEEQPAVPVHPNDESYDRAQAAVTRNKLTVAASCSHCRKPPPRHERTSPRSAGVPLALC